MKNTLRKAFGYACLAGAALQGLALTAGTALADGTSDDMTTTLTSINGYWTTAEGIGIAIILFVLGRKVVKKI